MKVVNIFNIIMQFTQSLLMNLIIIVFPMLPLKMIKTFLTLFKIFKALNFTKLIFQDVLLVLFPYMLLHFYFSQSTHIYF